MSETYLKKIREVLKNYKFLAGSHRMTNLNPATRPPQPWTQNRSP